MLIVELEEQDIYRLLVLINNYIKKYEGLSPDFKLECVEELKKINKIDKK